MLLRVVETPCQLVGVVVLEHLEELQLLLGGKALDVLVRRLAAIVAQSLE